MRSIGLKIFLGFWLTHALIFVVLGLLPNNEPVAGWFALEASYDGSVAAALHAGAGQTACTDFLTAVRRQRAVEVGLFDGQGKPVCGSTDSPEMARLAADHARDERDFVRSERDHDQAVLSVADPGGNRYRVAAISRGWPGTQPRRPFPTTFLVVAVLASGLVCIFLTWYLTRPIQAMRRATHRLAGGELEARAGSEVGSRKDEIGDLVRDFDAMAERIESLIGSQKQLLSDISHELRSPLARLQVALELARRKAGPAAEADLARIQAETDRMTDLIAQLLAVSKAEGDARARRLETFDLSEVVREIAEDADFEARTEGKSVQLHVERTPSVQGDPGLLSSAIENVVRNASRHTGEGTSVEVVVTAREDRARVTVRDHGPGVPDSALREIFAPFYRVGTSRDRSSGGVGLGLSIAQRAVTLHGGVIVATNAPDGGLVVTIDLPAVSVGPAADASAAG